MDDVIEGECGGVAVGGMEDDDCCLGSDPCFQEQGVYADAFPEKSCAPSFNAEDCRHFWDRWMIGYYLVVGIVKSLVD